MNPIHRHAQPLPDLAGTGAQQPPAADDAGLPGARDAHRGEPARLVAHVVESLASASADSGLPDLIRHLPPERYRHAIVCLRDADGDAAEAGLRDQGVEILRLHRRGEERPSLLQLHRLLRRLRPALLHTHCRAALPAQLAAAFAGVGLRVHAERGGDPARPGAARHARTLRLLRPLVDHFFADSAGLARWLVEAIGADPARVSRIASGVDSVQFHPRLGPAAAVGPAGFLHDGVFVIGSIGRMDDSAGHVMLVDAFLRLIASPHPAHQRLRLMLVGEGPARIACQAMLNRAGAAARAWLPGARADGAQLLRAMDLFVQAPLQEHGGAAILEAMASGLPVVAATFAANAELVHAGFTGILVPPASVELLAAAIADYCRIPEMAARHGARARSQVIARHSMPALARDYLAVYDRLTGVEAPDAGARPG